MNKEIKPLTSFRFFAALAVFLYHIPYFSGAKGQFCVREGYVGVSFFFLLSGFILAYNYHEKFICLKKDKIRNFYTARIARIYPTHVLTFFASIPMLLGGNFYRVHIPGCVRISAINFLLLQSFMPKIYYYFSYNIVSWSLSDEMFFYLLFPFLIFAYYQMKPGLVKILFAIVGLWILTAIPVFIFIQKLPHDYDLAYWLFNIVPFSRIIDFTVGILLFFLYSRILSQSLDWKSAYFTFAELTSIVLLAAAFRFSSHAHQYYHWAAYYMPFMALMILVFAFSKGGVSSFLSRKYFVLLGELSFAFYMFHNLVLMYMKQSGALFFKTHQVSGGFIAFFATLLISCLSYAYFEIPMRGWIKKMAEGSRQAKPSVG